MTEAGYRDGSGRPVALGALLGAGGEGSVFAVVGSARRCAKIYRPDRAAARADKILAMLARRPPWLLRRGVAWPVEALHEGASGAFAGFLMPARRGMIELYQLLVPDERMACAGFVTQRDLCLVAARLAEIVAGLHRAGHCVGDLKPQNVLVDPRSGSVALIDADSFQVGDPRSGATHRSLVVTPEYTAPELCGVDPARVDRTPASDAFALAVLIHQLLLGGAHPFDGELAPGARAGSVERVPGRIRRGLCPLVPGVTAVRPAAGAPPFASLPEPLRPLLVRAFGAGHATPTARPDAATLGRALRLAAGAMVRCPVSAAHLHDPRLPRCPFCERRERSGIDPFPEGQAWQRSLARAPRDPAAVPEAERLRRLGLHVRGRLMGGKVTAAERAWLEKTGAALGFDRDRVARAIDEAAAPRVGPGARLADLARRLRARRRVAERLPAVPARPPEVPARLPARLPALSLPLPGRRGLALVAVSLVAGTVYAAGVVTAARSAADPVARPAPRLPACAVADGHAAIGNTQGKGAFLRGAPSTASEKLPMPDGTVVRLTGRTEEADERVWSEVDVPLLGRSGWVSTKYLVEPGATAEKAR